MHNQSTYLIVEPLEMELLVLGLALIQFRYHYLNLRGLKNTSGNSMGPGQYLHLPATFVWTGAEFHSLDIQGP